MLSASRNLSRPLCRRAASTIATKYSSAVYNAALAKNPATLDKVAGELKSIATTLASTPELNEVITNPTLKPEDRQIVLNSLFAKSQGSAKAAPVSDITKNLFTVLADNGRLAEAPGVIEGFNELFSEYKGELNIVITSATPLSKEILARLEGSLKQSQAGQKSKLLKVSNKVRRLFSFCLLRRNLTRGSSRSTLVFSVE